MAATSLWLSCWHAGKIHAPPNGIRTTNLHVQHTATLFIRTFLDCNFAAENWRLTYNNSNNNNTTTTNNNIRTYSISFFIFVHASPSSAAHGAFHTVFTAKRVHVENRWITIACAVQINNTVGLSGEQTGYPGISRSRHVMQRIWSSMICSPGASGTCGLQTGKYEDL